MNFYRFRRWRARCASDEAELDQVQSPVEHERRLQSTACGICAVLGFLLGLALAFALASISYVVICKRF